MHDWLFLCALMAVALISAVVAFVVPVSRSGKHKYLRIIAIAVFILSLGYVLFWILFMFLFSRHFPII